MSKIMYMDREYSAVDSDVKVYTADWIATSSSANQVKVTDSLTLPAGVYIGIIKAPVCSQTSTYFAMRPTPSNYSTGGYVGSQQTVSFEFTLVETTTVDIVTNMSTATTYSNIDRGWFKAIRLKALEDVTNETISHETTLNLGSYVTGALLTSAAGALTFCIPTGRTYPIGTTIKNISFNIVVRGTSANGTGYYIIKKTSGNWDAISVNSSSSATFYNGNNVATTLSSSNWSYSLQGRSNIQITLAGTDNYFSGNATIAGYINNNAATVSLGNIVVTLNVPG